MGLKSVTIQLPEDIYNTMQAVAEASHRSVEDMICDSLDIFFSDFASANIDALLNQMSGYTDSQLWVFVYRNLSISQCFRLKRLSAKNKRGQLKDIEQSELDHLLKLMDRWILLRSQALLLLKQRRYDIDTFLKMRS